MMSERTEQDKFQKEANKRAKQIVKELAPLIRDASLTGLTTTLTRVIDEKRKFLSFFPKDVREVIMQKIANYFPK